MRLAVAIGLVCSALGAFARATEPARARGIPASIAAQIAAALPSDLQLTDVTVPETLAGLSSGDVSITWRSAPRPGPVSVLATVRSGQKEIGRAWVGLKLSAVRSVLVARRPLRAGERIMEGDIDRAARAVEDGAGWQLDPRSLTGLAILRDVPAGRLLGGEDVALPAPLPRETPVRLIARRGAVEVSVSAVLERPARLGELAEARTLLERRVVTGRLVNRSTVLVGEE